MTRRLSASVGRSATAATVALVLLAAAGCEAPTYAYVDPHTVAVDETPDLVTPAMLLVTNEGGNTIFRIRWQLDSATATVTFLAEPKNPLMGVPSRLVVRTLPTPDVARLFTAATTHAIRILPGTVAAGGILPDISPDELTIVANGRRKTIRSGPLPAVAQLVADSLKATIPPPP